MLLEGMHPPLQLEGGVKYFRKFFVGVGDVKNFYFDRGVILLVGGGGAGGRGGVI